MLKREYFQSRYCHEKIQTVHPYNFYTSGPFDKIIQQIKRRYLINPWLLGEKYKPIIIRAAGGAPRASPWHQLVSPIRFANGGT